MIDPSRRLAHLLHLAKAAIEAVPPPWSKSARADPSGDHLFTEALSSFGHP